MSKLVYVFLLNYKVTRFLLQAIHFQLDRVLFVFQPFIQKVLFSTYPLTYGSFTSVVTGQT